LGRLTASRSALGAPEETIHLYEEVLSRKPTFAPACNALAWFYATGPEKLRNPQKALSLAQKAIALAPQNPEFANTLGVVYYRLEKYEQAIETLAKGSYASGQFFLAMCHRQLGETMKAQECQRRAVELLKGSKLAPSQSAEMKRIQSEAEAVLTGPNK
jgi:tetratricopeptide (TPR) repeat protein